MMIFRVVLVLCVAAALRVEAGGRSSQEYGDALTKSILFFEGQRSGKLPSSQRVKWRGDSALTDGSQVGVDLVGGYYDAGDNVKFNFPMAFTTTMLSWSVIEFGKYMGTDDLNHARTSVRWATDYLLKSTSVPGFIYAQVGDAHRDHNCWERPEDMDTPRTPYAVSKSTPGSEVAGEIAAALAAASLVFKLSDHDYSVQLLKRAFTVFRFADIYRGTYKDSLGPWVCDFYCSYNGYKDELIWAAAWIFKATKVPAYGDYVRKHIVGLGGSFAEFGWDNKHAGINVLVSKLIIDGNLPNSGPFLPQSDKLICSIHPKSPYPSVTYSPAGLLFKPGGSNLQHVTTLSFLSLVYARYIGHSSRKLIHCPDTHNKLIIKPSTILKMVKHQVDYILGDNPARMSYMVGYGSKYPTKIHHRAASLPSIHQVRERIECDGGKKYFFSTDPDPNVLVGAVVGGPDEKDRYDDGNRADFVHSEPATYINAPFVGVLAYFKKYPFQT